MTLENFDDVAEEVSRFEQRLKEEDFSAYTIEGVECERNELEMLWVKFKAAHERQCVEAKEKKKVFAKYNFAHRTYIRCVNIIAIAKRSFSEKESKSVAPRQEFSVHVPPCDTGVFRGDYVSWPTFRDLFTAIYINNTRLSPVEKLFYLFQKTDGEAREINRNIALTAENFEIAWTNLKSQYENKRVLINSQLRHLFNMAPCKQDSPHEVKRLQRDVNNCISVLKLFDIDIGSWDPIFVFLCSARLSEQTLNLWEQSVKNKTEIPEWKELNEFLTDRFHALESVSDIIATNNQWPRGSQTVAQKSHQTSTKVKHSKALHTKVDVAQCKLCKESHSISSCQKFLSMDQKTRASTLRKFKYCFNCLKIGHMYINCTNPNGCSRCSKKHHTLLHRDFVNKPNQPEQTNEVAQSSSQANNYRNENIQSTGKLEALVVAHVTGDIPTHSLCPTVDMNLPKLDYADPDFYKSSQIDVLLGGDLYPTILRGGVQHGIFDSLVAQETIFGWIVTGPTAKKDPLRSVRVSHLTKVSIDDQLAKFWELEEVARKPMLSEDDKKCEEIYCSTTKKRPDGRYVVDLPFKSNLLSLGLNRYIALRQFLRNEKSLLGKPDYKNQYDEVIKEYLTLDHMEKVENPDCGPCYYLPHHGVFKPESTTTKLRVVFNASSATSTGVSLNDMLFVGPVLQADLVALVLKWRFFEFVFNADISKMYRQIFINPEHSRFQRIVFRESEDEEISDYQLNTVTFGVNCAPYLALRTLLKLADDEQGRFPIGANLLRSSMYLDDALVGAHSVSEALVVRSQLIEILKSAGFELRKWTSNSRVILEGLPIDHLLNCNFLCLDDKSTAKTLGVRWNASGDYFYFETEKIARKVIYTKREVLSLIARLFDPAGWLAPVIVTAKIIMQDIWLDKIGWDDEIKTVALHKWQNFISKYNEVDSITIPRWIKFSPNCKIEYHGFCDSSELAYAATLYVRVQKGDQVCCNLLVAKTKVAPIKKPSLPRLELCGAVLLAELVESMLSQFETKDHSLFLWSDSTIVLAWLKKSPCSWKTFVANRVAIILEKVGNINWSHVPSNHNPADLATRGLIPSELKDNSLWWHGPEWLISEKSLWPTTSRAFDTVEEAKNVQVYVARSSDDEDILDRFSSLSRAIHVLAYVFRFCQNARNRKQKEKELVCSSLRVSAEELTFVRNRLFLLSQLRYFPTEHSCLTEKKNLLSNSPLLTLTPFLDRNRIIRANGRLGSTRSLTYHERHPIVLAYGSRLARLYVDFIHKLVLHGGPRLVLNTIRLECWILKAKNLVKLHTRNCKECVLYKKKFQGQVMAALPEERTTFTRPFTTTGVDFAGPFDIKSFTGRYCRITKGYTCLFVCFSTKAIHLEAVSDLSTPAFLAALARFVSRRGCPSKIYSDNGRNFVGAARQIDSNFVARVQELKDEAISKYGHQKLSWHFIPAAAPHMGGLWEAGVKSFKMHLKKVSGQLRHTFEEFSTLLATIEACLNSRPLGSLSNDVEDLSALTPGHFLIGSPILTPAESDEVAPVDSILNRWRKLKAMNSELCRRWKEEYLKELNKRNKWKTAQVDIQVNDLVVIRNEPVCPTEWRLGRVTKVFRGSDNRVRVAELKTQNGSITRPIHKMVLLPRDA